MTQTIMTRGAGDPLRSERACSTFQHHNIIESHTSRFVRGSFILSKRWCAFVNMVSSQRLWKAYPVYSALCLFVVLSVVVHLHIVSCTAATRRRNGFDAAPITPALCPACSPNSDRCDCDVKLGTIMCRRRTFVRASWFDRNCMFAKKMCVVLCRDLKYVVTSVFSSLNIS